MTLMSIKFWCFLQAASDGESPNGRHQPTSLIVQLPPLLSLKKICISRINSTTHRIISEARRRRRVEFGVAVLVVGVEDLIGHLHVHHVHQRAAAAAHSAATAAGATCRLVLETDLVVLATPTTQHVVSVCKINAHEWQTHENRSA